MSISDQATRSVPGRLAGLIPSPEKILLALGNRTYTFKLDTEFIRAAHNAKYVKTASPYKAHRFGPPLEFVKQDGTLEFNWLYMATDVLVAAWESQLVVNNRGAGNGYHLACSAVETGVIARIRVKRALSLWNLGEDHCSRLGIHDIISSQDHECCQWLGYRIRQAMLMIDEENRPDGFVYPSRRVKGFPALAIADWAAADLFVQADVIVEPFARSDIHAYFTADPMLTSRPEADTPRSGA